MQNIQGLVFTLFLGLFILVGAFIVFLTKNNKKFITFSIALALSVIVMLIFTDLGKEAYEMLGKDNVLFFILFVILGFLLLKMLDIFVPDHEHHEHETNKEDTKNLSHIGKLSSIAIIIHNVIEGMAIYTTIVSNPSVGFMVSLGVGLHNIPLGMAITSTLYQSNKDKKKTYIYIFALSLSTFLGGLLLFIFGNNISEFILGVLLSLTIGMLCFISICELLPRVINSKDKKTTVMGLLLGIILMTATLFL
ncbi:MAG: ZIP family metal transporter [Bacilli bacterium]